MMLNALDWMALVILVVSLIGAFIKGFLAELISLGSVVAGAILAVLFYTKAGSFLQDVGVQEQLSGFLGFIIVFLGCVIAGAVLSRILKRLMKALRLRWVDRLLGGLFGLIRGWLINVVLFVALTAFPVGGSLLEKSRLAEFFLTSAGMIALLAPQEFKAKFSEGYQAIYSKWIEETRQEDESEQTKTHD